MNCLRCWLPIAMQSLSGRSTAPEVHRRPSEGLALMGGSPSLHQPFHLLARGVRSPLGTEKDLGVTNRRGWTMRQSAAMKEDSRKLRMHPKDATAAVMNDAFARSLVLEAAKLTSNATPTSVRATPRTAARAAAAITSQQPSPPSSSWGTRLGGAGLLGGGQSFTPQGRIPAGGRDTARSYGGTHASPRPLHTPAPAGSPSSIESLPRLEELLAAATGVPSSKKPSTRIMEKERQGVEDSTLGQGAPAVQPSLAVEDSSPNESAPDLTIYSNSRHKQPQAGVSETMQERLHALMQTPATSQPPTSSSSSSPAGYVPPPPRYPPPSTPTSFYTDSTPQHRFRAPSEDGMAVDNGTQSHSFPATASRARHNPDSLSAAVEDAELSVATTRRSVDYPQQAAPQAAASSVSSSFPTATSRATQALDGWADNSFLVGLITAATVVEDDRTASSDNGRSASHATTTRGLRPVSAGASRGGATARNEPATPSSRHAFTPSARPHVAAVSSVAAVESVYSRSHVSYSSTITSVSHAASTEDVGSGSGYPHPSSRTSDAYIASRIPPSLSAGASRSPLSGMAKQRENAAAVGGEATEFTEVSSKRTPEPKDSPASRGKTSHYSGIASTTPPSRRSPFLAAAVTAFTARGAVFTTLSACNKSRRSRRIRICFYATSAACKTVYATAGTICSSFPSNSANRVTAKT